MTFRKTESQVLRTLGIAFALLNLTLGFSVSAIRTFVDGALGRTTVGGNPQIINGVQELFVYFDPWLALWVFPVIYTVGFAAIPFLRKQCDRQPPQRSSGTYAVAVAFVLIGLEMVWLFLIAVGVVLRGPNWNIYWPWEPWDQFKIELLNYVDLSEYFWLVWMNRPLAGMPWPLRELPGLMLIGSYLLAGVVIAHCLYNRWQRVTPYWRCLSLVLLVQMAALVPVKMLLRWTFHLKYFIAIPEYFWNV